MSKILIIGGGWAGCGAAVSAAKQGAEVTLIEKTDLLLGAGNVGGIMRNNGRFTATEENMAMGASELFEITDQHAVHRNVDFPGHRHASFYDGQLVEPAVRRLLQDFGVAVRFCSRAVDVKWDFSAELAEKAVGKKIEAVEVMQDGAPIWMEADAFVEATGSSGPMGNCAKYGKGCAMCIQRCPSFGPRVSLTARAGACDLTARRSGTDAAYKLGALSGSCKLEKKSLSSELQARLSRDGFAVIPLPDSLIRRSKLSEKVCQQYALDTFAENLILIDTGQAKLMTSYFNLEELLTVAGFEQVTFLDPYAGGRGNSVRSMSVSEREDTMRAAGFTNLFLGGEKSGFFVGHTEAITTGSLAGYNAASQTRQTTPTMQTMQTRQTTQASQTRQTTPIMQGLMLPDEGSSAEPSSALSPDGLLRLPRTLVCGELLAYAQEALQEEDGLYRRFTFAGGEFFQRMEEMGLYTTESEAVRNRVRDAGLLNIYNLPTALQM